MNNDSGTEGEETLEGPSAELGGDLSLTAGATNGLGQWAASASFDAVQADMVTYRPSPNLSFEVDMSFLQASVSAADGGSASLNLAVAWVSINGMLRSQDAHLFAAQPGLQRILESGRQIRIQGRVGIKIPASDLRHLSDLSRHLQSAENAANSLQEAQQDLNAARDRATDFRRRKREAQRALRELRGRPGSRAEQRALRQQITGQRNAMRDAEREARRLRRSVAQAEQQARTALRQADRAREGLSRPLGRALGDRLRKSFLTRIGRRGFALLARAAGPVGVAITILDTGYTLYNIARGAQAFGIGVDGADEAADNPADSIEEGGTEDRENAAGLADGEGGDSGVGRDGEPVEGGTEATQNAQPPRSANQETAEGDLGSEVEPNTEQQPEAAERSAIPTSFTPLEQVSEFQRQRRIGQYAAVIAEAEVHGRSWFFKPADRTEQEPPRVGQRLEGVLVLPRDGEFIAGTTRIRIVRMSGEQVSSIRHPRMSATDQEGNVVEVQGGTLSRTTDSQ